MWPSWEYYKGLYFVSQRGSLFVKVQDVVIAAVSSIETSGLSGPVSAHVRMSFEDFFGILRVAKLTLGRFHRLQEQVGNTTEAPNTHN